MYKINHKIYEHFSKGIYIGSTMRECKCESPCDRTRVILAIYTKTLYTIVHSGVGLHLHSLYASLRLYDLNMYTAQLT